MRIAGSETLQELDKTGAEAIKLVRDFTEKGIEFVQEQAPDLCNEIVARALWQNWFGFFIWLSISIIFLIASIISFNLFKKYYKKYGRMGDEFDTSGNLTLSILMLIFSLASFFAGCGYYIYHIGNIYVAPKIYLLEYFNELVRQ